MTILDRVATLIRANINDLLDRAEDPEKMLDQIIRDMAEEINRAKAQVAETIAQKNLIEGNLGNSQKLAGEWQNKAEMAVDRGRDDLAREALRRKKDYDTNARIYDEQLIGQRDAVDKLKNDLMMLQSKYEEVVRSREMLIARHRTAQARKKVVTAAASMARIDPTSELRRMEEKIRMGEARAKALEEVNDSSVDAQFRQLEADDDVEDDLRALKSRVAGQLNAPSDRGPEKDER